MGHIDLSRGRSYSATARDASGNTGTMVGCLYTAGTGGEVLHATPGVRETFAIMSNLSSNVIEGFETASRAGDCHDVLNLAAGVLHRSNRDSR